MHVTKPPTGDRPLKTLERVLSKAGIGSRTQARTWIGGGRVRVNGSVVRDPDAWVDLERDHIELDGKPLRSEKPTYLLLHKPTGYLTTRRDPQGRPTIFDLLPDRERHLVHVGRLDFDTSGLLILTNDTQFAERMTNPQYHMPKTYFVETSRLLTDEELDILRRGIELDDGPTRPAQVDRMRERGGESAFEVTITEGRNRQVRRMVEALDAKVLKLVRVAIGAIRIGELPIGKAREMTADEVATLTGAGSQGSRVGEQR